MCSAMRSAIFRLQWHMGPKAGRSFRYQYFLSLGCYLSPFFILKCGAKIQKKKPSIIGRLTCIIVPFRQIIYFLIQTL
jgi:hypothetical protein